MWFHGRPHFLSAAAAGDKVDDGVYAAYTALCVYVFASCIAAKREVYKRETDCLHAWFDNLGVGLEGWEKAERVRFNFDSRMSFVTPTTGGSDGVMPEAAIGDQERVRNVVGRGLWGEKWTEGEARRFLSVNLPDFSSREGWRKMLSIRS